MRFSYAESMTEPLFYAPLAIAAQEAGCDYGRPGQHLLPEGRGQHLSVHPDGTREFLEDKPFLEPFS